MKKYNLDLVASTFIILDSNEASMQVSVHRIQPSPSNPLTPPSPDRLRVAKVYRRHHQPGQPAPVRLEEGPEIKTQCNIQSL